MTVRKEAGTGLTSPRPVRRRSHFADVLPKIWWRNYLSHLLLNAAFPDAKAATTATRNLIGNSNHLSLARVVSSESMARGRHAERRTWRLESMLHTTHEHRSNEADGEQYYCGRRIGFGISI